MLIFEYLIYIVSVKKKSVNKPYRYDVKSWPVSQWGAGATSSVSVDPELRTEDLFPYKGLLQYVMILLLTGRKKVRSPLGLFPQLPHLPQLPRPRLRSFGISQSSGYVAKHPKGQAAAQA